MSNDDLTAIRAELAALRQRLDRPEPTPAAPAPPTAIAARAATPDAWADASDPRTVPPDIWRQMSPTQRKEITRRHVAQSVPQPMFGRAPAANPTAANPSQPAAAVDRGVDLAEWKALTTEQRREIQARRVAADRGGGMFAPRKGR